MTVRMPNQHLLATHADKIGVSADNAPALFLQVDPEKWPNVNEAWAKLRDKYNLDQGGWDKATWDFLSFVLGGDWSCIATMSKARRLGWDGHADTWEELEHTFRVLEEAGILPPVDKLRAEF